MEAIKNMAGYTDAQKKASLKYHREHLAQIKFAINKNTEQDLLVWLDSQENKQGYLKQLIREDMKKHGFMMEENEK